METEISKIVFFTISFLFFVQTLWAQSKPRMEINAGASAVTVERSGETMAFATAGLEFRSEENPWTVGLHYFRSLVVSASAGSLAFTNIRGGYLLKRGEWRKDFLWGVAADYQIGGFNFGQIPMLGVSLFSSGLTGFKDWWWEAQFAGLYTSLNNIYEVTDTWRADAAVGRSIATNAFLFLSYDYRSFTYHFNGTSGGFSQLSLSSLALGLGLTY